jgi:hypothetical protein
MPILGRARPAFRSCRHAVALQNIDLFEISRQGACRRQTADATTHHHCTPTEKAAHSATLQRFWAGRSLCAGYGSISAGQKSATSVTQAHFAPSGRPDAAKPARPGFGDQHHELWRAPGRLRARRPRRRVYGAEACLYLAVAIFVAQALVILLSPAVSLARQPDMVAEPGKIPRAC